MQPMSVGKGDWCRSPALKGSLGQDGRLVNGMGCGRRKVAISRDDIEEFRWPVINGARFMLITVGWKTCFPGATGRAKCHFG